MTLSDDFVEHVVEKLRFVNSLSTRKMFGGMGLYANGIFFAILYDDVLYFKVDDANRSQYEMAASRPFQPFGGKRPSSSYYEVPPEVLKKPKALRTWTDAAVEAARNSKK